MSAATERLEELRVALRTENISYSELAELQSLAEHIAPGDTELLEGAGVPEHKKVSSATDRLDEHVAPKLRDRGWNRPIADDEPDPAVMRAAATFYDPHGNHVETVEGTCAHVGEEAGGYLARMAADGYPCTVIIEPEED